MDRAELGCLRCIILFNPGKNFPKCQISHIYYENVVVTAFLLNGNLDYSSKHPFNIYKLCMTFLDVRSIKSAQEVEILREKVYGVLEEYCRVTHPDEPGRFAKLLLRLPALRSIGLKCLEHLFFFRMIGDVSIDTFLTEVLDTPNDTQEIG